MNDELDLSDPARRWRWVFVLVTWLASLLAACLPSSLLLGHFLLPFFPAGLAVAFGYSGLEFGWGFATLTAMPVPERALRPDEPTGDDHGAGLMALVSGQPSPILTVTVS